MASRPDSKTEDTSERQLNSSALDTDAIERDVSTMGRAAVVREASPTRSQKQRAHLRGLGHALKPTATIGHNGTTDAFAGALDSLLEQHELVKVKLLESAPCSPEAASIWIHRVLRADVVQILGRTLLAYRARDEKPRIKLPSA